jgi:hypothetical protein
MRSNTVSYLMEERILSICHQFSIIICYTSVRINIPLLSPVFLSRLTCYRMMRLGKYLTPSPTNNKHKQQIVDSYLYTVCYTSYTHILILSIFTEIYTIQIKKYCWLVRNLLNNVLTVDVNWIYMLTMTISRIHNSFKQLYTRLLNRCQFIMP